tara:strand:+ start:694 stop:867 length:174 start_codon:yes stop_codon:yes gene_type:complete
MDIIEARYQQHENKNVSVRVVLSNGNRMSIPMTEENRHYAEILKQVKEGTLTIQDAD